MKKQKKMVFNYNDGVTKYANFNSSYISSLNYLK